RLGHVRPDEAGRARNQHRFSHARIVVNTAPYPQGFESPLTHGRPEMRLLALLLALTLAPWAPAQNSDPAAPPSEAAIRVLGPGGVEAWYVPDPANPSRYIPHSGPAGIAETLESGWIGGPWG